MPTDIKHRIYSRKRHGKPERTNYLQYLELWNQNVENFTFLTARKLGNWKNKTCSLKYSPTNHIEESTESAPLQCQSISTQLFFVPISWNRSRLDQIDHHKHHISTNTSTRRKSQTQISPQISPQTSPQTSLQPSCQHMFLSKTTLHKHTLNCSSWRPYKYSSCPKRFYYKINQASLPTNISLWHLLHFYQI